MKKYAVLILALLILVPGFFYPQPVHAADEETVSYLIPGKVEWWHDKARNTYWIDYVRDGLTVRQNIGQPPHPYIDAEFPSALVSGVENVSKYTVKSVTIADASDIGSIKYSGEVDIDSIFKYKLQNAILKDQDAIIGRSGTLVSFKAHLQVPAYDRLKVYSFTAANNVQCYRVYVPIKVTFAVTPLVTPNNATITVNGVVDPNPSELTADGYAYPNLTVSAEVKGLDPDDQVLTQKLEMFPEGGGGWTGHDGTGPGNTFSHEWPLKISKDTKIDIRATATTKKGKTLTATGSVVAYVVSGMGDLVAKVTYTPTPQTVTITQRDYDANKPMLIQLEADSSQSTATNGIRERLYYWQMGHNPCEYSGWTNQSVYRTSTWVNPKDADAVNEIHLIGRVAIKDNKGFVGYALDDEIIKLQIIATPPETVLSGPAYLLPKELGKPNTFTWTYNSPDNIPYGKSLVSVSRMTADGSYEVVIPEQEQTDRTIDVQGSEYETYKVAVKVVDSKGNISLPSELVRTVITTRPAISLKASINNDKIDVVVTDKTAAAIIDLAPTRYVNWTVLNSQGAVIYSGTGHIPAQFDNDSRFAGGVATFIQTADNALGKTAKAQDTLIFNSLLDFDIVPNVLYESQYALFKDLSKFLTDKTHTIKGVSEPDTSFAPLELTPENTFTEPEGVYNVKLAGKGYQSTKLSLWQYANDRTELLDSREPAAPSADFVKTFAGDSALYAIGSATFTGDIQQSIFYSGGAEYRFRRQVDCYGVDRANFQDVKNVTFKMGTPVCGLTVTGEKQYREVDVDLRPSSDATEASLQAAYPIQYDSGLTYVDVAYLKDNAADPAQAGSIHGTNRQVVDGWVRFSGLDSHKLRFDEAGTVEIRGVVYNGLKQSKPFVIRRVIVPDTPPAVTVKLDKNVDYRDPKYNLATTMHVNVDYSSDDGDAVDLDKSVLLLSFDANHNGNFADDGAYSTMTVTRGSDNLQPIIKTLNKTYAADHMSINLGIDNAAHNALGEFLIQYKAVDMPSTPYLSVPDAALPVVSNDPGKTVTHFLADNQAPAVDFQLTRSVSITDVIIDTPGCTPLNLPYILEQAKLNNIKLKIVHVDENGVRREYTNYGP